MLISNYLSATAENNKKIDIRNASLSSMSFKGLRGMLSRTIYEDDKFIQKLVDVYPRADSKVGALPKQILEIIKSRVENHSKVSEVINHVQTSFSELSDILRERVESLKKLESKASIFFTEAMRKNGIISKNASVKVKYIDEGSFGEVYNITFRNENGKRLFSDKALKVYYLDKQDNFSGVNAEANSALYLKKSVGHPLLKSNLIPPYFFDLRRKFALFEMANDTLGFSTKRTDFKGLGVSHTDLAREANFVCGRIVDFGDIKVKNPIVVANKVARRIHKKISSIKSGCPETQTSMRVSLWKRYYSLAITNKLPQRNDVLIGLKEARELIPITERNLLPSIFNQP